MPDLHIDDFFKDAARTIVALYGVFPRSVPVYVEDISGPDEPDEYGVHSPRHQACFAAMLWLGEEGFIRFEDTIRAEALDMCVLTGRCFSLLMAPTDAPVDEALPDRVRDIHRSAIHQLAEAVKTNDVEGCKKLLLPILNKLSSDSSTSVMHNL